MNTTDTTATPTTTSPSVNSDKDVQQPKFPLRIFFLDPDPRLAARSLCDQHIRDLLGEAVTLLSWVSGTNGGPRPTKRTRGVKDSPKQVRWLAGSLANFGWLRDHAWELWLEHGRRFSLDSKHRRHLEGLLVDPPSLPDTGLTAFQPTQTHEDLFGVPGDPVASWRRHYAFLTLALPDGGTWRGDRKPAWIDEIRQPVTPGQLAAIQQAIQEDATGQHPKVLYIGTDPETQLDLITAERTTAMHESKEFAKKGLSTHALEVGFTCDHACAYCSVRASLWNNPVFKRIGHTAFETGYAIIDLGVVDRLYTEDPKLTADNVVMVCTLSDAWTPAARRYGIGRGCLEYLLERTPAQVRILTKNANIRQEFPFLAEYQDRVMVGISITGLPEHEPAMQAIEPHASPITERIAAMEEANELGLRTYAMFCPLLPGIFHSAEQFDRLFGMAATWNVEDVWAEAVNRRGPSIKRCAEELRSAGFAAEATAADAIRVKRRWSTYAAWLTKEVQAAARRADMIDRLHILNYRESFQPADQAAITEDPAGVIWLG